MNKRSLMKSFIPKAKLDRNIRDLKKIPQTHNYVHVIPIRGERWDIISFYNFLLTLNISINNTPYFRGRTGHYKGKGECHFCQKKLYHILIDKDKKQITFILLSVCEHLRLSQMEFEGNLITYITEYNYGKLFKKFDSAANYFLLHMSTWEHPMELSHFINSNLIKGYPTSNVETDLLQFINNVPGEWYLYINKEQGFYKHEKGFIDTIVWICPWANSIIRSFQYLILDSSFKVMRPYTYSIPLMVKNNLSIPIGFSIAISEKE